MAHNMNISQILNQAEIFYKKASRSYFLIKLAISGRRGEDYESEDDEPEDDESEDDEYEEYEDEDDESKDDEDEESESPKSESPKPQGPGRGKGKGNTESLGKDWLKKNDQAHSPKSLIEQLNKVIKATQDTNTSNLISEFTNAFSKVDQLKFNFSERMEDSDFINLAVAAEEHFDSTSDALNTFLKKSENWANPSMTLEQFKVVINNSIASVRKIIHELRADNFVPDSGQDSDQDSGPDQDPEGHFYEAEVLTEGLSNMANQKRSLYLLDRLKERQKDRRKRLKDRETENDTVLIGLAARRSNGLSDYDYNIERSAYRNKNMPGNDINHIKRWDDAIDRAVHDYQLISVVKAGRERRYKKLRADPIALGVRLVLQRDQQLKYTRLYSSANISENLDKTRTAMANHAKFIAQADALANLAGDENAERIDDLGRQAVEQASIIAFLAGEYKALIQKEEKRTALSGAADTKKGEERGHGRHITNQGTFNQVIKGMREHHSSIMANDAQREIARIRDGIILKLDSSQGRILDNFKNEIRNQYSTLLDSHKAITNSKNYLISTDSEPNLSNREARERAKKTIATQLTQMNMIIRKAAAEQASKESFLSEWRGEVEMIASYKEHFIETFTEFNKLRSDLFSLKKLGIVTQDSASIKMGFENGSISKEMLLESSDLLYACWIEAHRLSNVDVYQHITKRNKDGTRKLRESTNKILLEATLTLGLEVERLAAIRNDIDGINPDDPIEF